MQSPTDCGLSVMMITRNSPLCMEVTTMRDRLEASIRAAMRERDALRLSTLRLMSAALKDQDIARRGAGDGGELPEAEIWALFSKMVRQREESARAYEEAGRSDMAKQERSEQDIIREFLPRPMSEEEVGAAIEQTIRETGAESIRDMGRVMNRLKEAYPGRMDFAKASARVKAALG
ncbi:MAG TPA: GatB/YqeY domain-containing protein [Paracoccaceae bacterium]|nr:GatB/YqeY domain-containing protein [Paracoccaceae bacterium]